jgi:membrane-bound serine protease (ClpP class)
VQRAKKVYICVMVSRWIVLLGALLFAPALAAQGTVRVVPLEGAIGPATSDFVVRAIESAARDKAQLVVLRMDTPGGLDTSMREIIKGILASPVPVATFVAPGGARAASAGTFILYASHIAAMAPATNLGAASPVAIGGPPQKGDKDEKAKDKEAMPSGDTLMRKATNDAAAYIRGLAQLRGRNADWAEKAVREAVSLSASDAVRIKVVDLVADDLPDLLKKVDGRVIEAGGGKRALATAGARAEQVEIDWRTKILAILTNPSVAYIMVLLGIYALIFEFTNPGLILPGVVGAICLLLAMYAFHLLPVNYAGLALIGLGIAFMVAEAFLPSFGSLGIGGLIAFVIGSVILIDSDLPAFEIPYALIAGIATASAAFLILVIGMLVRSRHRPVVTGREQLVGEYGVVLSDCDSEGWARVHGESWRVRSSVPLRRGDRVRVTSLNGLVLNVARERDAQEGG